MAFKHFNHLNVPDSWERYFTKYPQGMTILEALFEWVSQVDSMVDNVNDWNTYLNNFVSQFDKQLQQTVTDTLTDWKESGFLDVVISEALQWELDNYIATNEADKLSLNAQLAQLDIEKASINYVDALLMDIAKGGPNALFNSLATLTATYPNGADGTFLVMDSSFPDGAHAYMWDTTNSVWKDLGVYQATGIADKSITSNKIANKSVIVGTHVKDSFKSTNLHNFETDMHGYSIDMETGNVIHVGGEMVLTDETDLSDVSTFTSIGFHNFVFFDNNGTLLSNIYLEPADRIIPKTHTKPLGASTMRMTYFPYVAATPYINSGNTLLPYEPFYHGIKFMKNNVDTNLVPSTNIFNKKTELKDTGIELTNPTSVGNEITLVGRNVSQHIPTTPEETITVKNAVNTVEFDRYGKFVLFNYHTASERLAGAPIKLSKRTFSVRIIYDNIYASVELQVNRGGVLLPWQPYEPVDITEQSGLSSSLLFKGTLLNVGDSIAQAHSLVGYHGYIGKKYRMTVHNYALGGATVRRIISEPTNHTLMEQVQRAINDGIKPTHILVNGNTNDYGDIGSISEGYDSTLDNTQYADAFEEIIRKLRTSFPESKILYISAHKMKSRGVSEKKAYTEVSYAICDKYSIDYADIFNRSQFNTYFASFVGKYTISPTDTTHPNDLGYEFGYNQLIENKLNTI